MCSLKDTERTPIMSDVSETTKPKGLKYCAVEPSHVNISFSTTRAKNENSPSVVNSVDNEPGFVDWLGTVKRRFQTLNDTEKTETLKEILDLCGSKQLQYLVQTYMPITCFVDFLKLLPTDISFHILTFLDYESVLHCCLVSKHWHDVVNSCRELWVQLCWIDGLELPSIGTAQDCKQHFLKIHHMLANVHHQTPHKMQYSCIMSDWGSFDKAFHYNQSIYLSGKGRNIVHCLTLDAGQEVVPSQIIKTCTVRDLNCDAQFLYVASDRMAATYELETSRLYREYHGHVSCVLCISACTTHDLMVTGSADMTIKLWNIHTTEIIYSTSEADCHRDWVCEIQFLKPLSPGTVIFVSTDTKHNVKVWAVTIDDEKVPAVSLLDTLVDCTKVKPTKNKCEFYCLQKQNPSSFTEDTICHYIIQNGIKDSENLCVQHVENFSIPHKISVDELVGIGRRFAAVLATVTPRYSQAFVILDLQRNHILVEKSFQPALAERKICLLECDWLDGFRSVMEPHCLFVVIEEDLIYMYNNPFSAVEENTLCGVKRGINL